jgi:hypothetical protein
MPPQNQIQETPDLPVYYMKMLSPNVDARLGKLSEGQIVPMDAAKATRYLTAHVAVQASESEYEEQTDRRSQKATAAQNAYRAINEGGAVWDVATYRDVLTAPEGGLRLAVERGIPLVNVHMLRDEDGDPLPPDADIEDILDARANLHPDLVAPFAAHDRSSVMGGGSPYVNNVQPGLSSPMPLSPQHRASMQRVADHEVMAQRPAAFSYDRNDPKAKREMADRAQGGERATRAARRNTPKPPAPTLSPDSGKAAEDAGVVTPSNELAPEQKV